MVDEQQLKDVAEKCVEQAAAQGYTLDYSPSSVIVLDSLCQSLYLSKKEVRPTTQQIWNAASLFGPYLGECILRGGLAKIGFTWGENPGGEPSLVREGTEDLVQPLGRVFRRIINGPDSDIIRFYSWCFDALRVELEQAGAFPATEYLAESGAIDAAVLCQLFAEDVLFVPDKEIVWDGSHHAFQEVKGNLITTLARKDFLSSLVTVSKEATRALLTIEQDDELHVSTDKLGGLVPRIIGEGDLTGLTLFRLLSAHAYSVAGEDGGFTVTYDKRIAYSIPGFYELVARMLTDLAVLDGAKGTVRIAFHAAEGELTPLLGTISAPVEGASLRDDFVLEVEL